jgi:hypothetical protein
MRWIRTTLFVALVFGTFFLVFHFLKFGPVIYEFANLRGPAEKTLLAKPITAQIDTFGHGSESRLAIVVTDKNSAWLGLAHGLKSIGIPFILTDDINRALKHKVMFIYPSLRESSLSVEQLDAIEHFVKKGGTLIGHQVYGARFASIFGFENTETVTTDTSLLLSKGPLTSAFTEPEELRLPIASGVGKTLGTYHFTKPTGERIAVYDDNTAAITRNTYGNGLTIAIGLDLGYLLQKGYNDRQENIAASYVNEYVPVLDVFLRLLKQIYVTAQKDAFVLSSTPFGKDLSVLLTHDIDSSFALKNALAYAEFEKSQGIKATYFVQTKYVRDWNDDCFFDDAGAGIVKELELSGAEVASHSVAHAQAFNGFALGNGAEQYPSYMPFVKSRNECENGTVLGELRVSRFLLESFLPQKRVVSFRPGHLKNPFTLPEALAATGYLYSSSTTANDSLTHLPFRLNYGRASAAETSIFEFPVTVEDEENPPMLKRLAGAVALAQKLKRYGALFTILIHPDVLGQKMEFEKGFVEAMASSAWFGTIRDFGDFWSARDQVEVDVQTAGGKTTLKLSAKKPISGLTLEVPTGLMFSGSAGDIQVTQQGAKLVVMRLNGIANLEFTNGFVLSSKAR